MTAKVTSRMGEVSYVIAVLWMAGWTAKAIGLATDKLRGSVKGIAQRRFEKSREEMTIEERQAVLNELKIDRRDNGILLEGHFLAVPLREVQKRPIGSHYGNKLLTGKKQAAAAEKRAQKPMTLQQRRRAERKAKDEDEHRRKQREAGLATRRGDAASALEFLANRQILTDAEDRGLEAFKKQIGSSGRRRLEAGLKLRGYFAGARIGGLKAVDVEMAGGGSALGMPPSTHKLHCMDSLGLIRSMMPQNDFLMIEAIVDQDDFPWDRIRPAAEDEDRKEANRQKRRDRAVDKARMRLYEEVRRALDVVAVYESLLTYEGFSVRWGRKLTKTPRADRYRAADASAEAAELLEAAGRPL